MAALAHLRPRRVILAVLCFVGVTAAGAVYMRLPGGHAAAARLAALGAQRRATYPMLVNGINAEVSIFGIDRPHAFVRPEILRAFGFDPSTDDNRHSAMFRFEHQGRRYLLMLPAVNPDRTLVFLTEFAPKTPQAAFPTHPVADWPRAPSETLRFSAVNSESRFALTMAESPADAETVRLDAARQLIANGWLPLHDELAALPSGGLYRRGEALCYMLATPSDHGGARLIVLRRDSHAPH